MPPSTVDLVLLLNLVIYKSVKHQHVTSKHFMENVVTIKSFNLNTFHDNQNLQNGIMEISSKVYALITVITLWQTTWCKKCLFLEIILCVKLWSFT